MQKVSAVSKQSGISLQEMAAIITVVSEDLRVAPENIGQAWKTILLRMQNVKLGKYLDDEGQNISDVETVLDHLGIKLRDGTDQWRDFSDVLKDVMVKWNELGSQGKTVEQSMIANTFAGQRQGNILIDLLNNQDKYNKALKIEADSLGTTEERYKIFTENIEASSNKFKAAWEKMWSTTIDEKWVKGFIDFGTAVLNLISNLGGLIPPLTAIAGLLAVINAQAIADNIMSLSMKIPKLALAYDAWAASLARVAAAQKAMSPSLFSNMGMGSKIGALSAATKASGAAGVGLLAGSLATVAGAGLAAYGLGTAAINYSEQERSMDKLVTQFEASRQSAKDSRRELESLADEYETLASKEDKTIEDRERLLEIQGIINGTYSETSAGLDLYTNAVDLNTDAIKRNVEAIREQARAQAELFLQENKGQYDTAKSFLSTKTRGIAKGKWTEFTPEERAKQLQSDINDLQKEGTQNSKTLAKAKQHELNLLKIQIANAKKIVAEYETQVDVLGLVEDKLKDVGKSAKKAFNWQGSGLKETARMTAEEFEKASQAYWEFADAQKTLSDSLQEFNETGSVSDETAQKLVEAGYGAAVSWDATNGAFTINKELLGQINIEMAQVAANAAQAAASEAQLALENATLAQSAESTLEPLRKQAIELQNVADAAQGRLDLLKDAGGLPAVTGTGGGGGGGAKSEKSAAQKQEEQNIKNSINGLEDKKKKLQDSLKEFKKYIDAQKDSLKLLKEEKEFNDELMKKNKQLAKLKTQITLLDLDNSEEAQAKKLELQEEAADIEEDIEQQKQDRIYEIQVEALDKAYDKFADSIDKQIEKIDELIEAWNNMLETLSNLATPGGSGGGGGNGGKGIFSAESKAARDKLISSGAVNISPYTTHGGGYIAESQVETFHSGGIVGLRPDERMIKAQVGETVLTRSQGNAIASLLSHAPSVSDTSSSYGSPQISMEFNVAGNLDKSVLPDIKTMANQMMKEINRTMVKRGNIRTVNLTAS